MKEKEASASMGSAVPSIAFGHGMPCPTEEIDAYAETSLDSEAATAIAAEAADATAGALASS